MSLLSFFISSAHAETSLPANAPPSNFPMVVILVGFAVFAYFTIFRPQNKRAKEQRDLLNSLAVNDEVITSGGILGRIVKLSDNYAVIAVNDTNEISIQKSAIANALPKGTLKTIAKDAGVIKEKTKSV